MEKFWTSIGRHICAIALIALVTPFIGACQPTDALVECYTGEDRPADMRSPEACLQLTQQRILDLEAPVDCGLLDGPEMLDPRDCVAQLSIALWEQKRELDGHMQMHTAAELCQLGYPPYEDADCAEVEAATQAALNHQVDVHFDDD